MTNARGEQTNIPTTPEEVEAATKKRLAAEKVEQEAHEAARAKDQQDAETKQQPKEQQ
jgi:hypothetical protein